MSLFEILEDTKPDVFERLDDLTRLDQAGFGVGGEKPPINERLARLLKISGGVESGRFILSHIGMFNAPAQIADGGKIKKTKIDSFSGVALKDRYSADEVCIYGLGVACTARDGSPVYYPPESGMRSVVRCPWSRTLREGLSTPLVPLFNVTEGGLVTARFDDEPTPEEYSLFHEIIDSFEQIADLVPSE